MDDDKTPVCRVNNLMLMGVALVSLTVGGLAVYAYGAYERMLDNIRKYPGSPLLDAIYVGEIVGEQLYVDQDSYDNGKRSFQFELGAADTYWHDPNDIEIIVVECYGGIVSKGTIVIKGNADHPHEPVLYDIATGISSVRLSKNGGFIQSEKQLDNCH